MLHFPETSSEHQKMKNLRDRGDVRRMAPGVYYDADYDEDQIFREGFPRILEAVAGDVRISHRSALYFNPDDEFFCVVDPTKSSTNARSIAGRDILILDGPEDPMKRVSHWIDEELAFSSYELALIESLEDRRGQFRRARLDPEKRAQWVYQNRDKIELSRLQSLYESSDRIPVKAESELNQIKAIVNEESEKINSVRIRRKMDAQGADDDRVKLFSDLADYLEQQPLPDNETVRKRPWSLEDPRQWDRFCFTASYFSNYVEGTDFAPKEAINIVNKGYYPDDPPDERTLVSTYQTYRELMNRDHPPIDDYSGFKDWIQAVHEDIAGENESLRPGKFKEKNNRAGTFYFVDSERVEETLEAGLADSSALDHPYYRALHSFFVVNEVHPFTDGNGRVARIMQDKILLENGYSGLMVTPMDRDFYLNTLRDTSRRNEKNWEESFLDNMNLIYNRNADPPFSADQEKFIQYLREECKEKPLENDQLKELEEIYEDTSIDPDPSLGEPGWSFP